MNYGDLAEKVAMRRKQLGWSQSDLAERVNVTRQTIGKIEAGDASSVSMGTVTRVMEELGLLVRIEYAFVKLTSPEDAGVDVDGYLNDKYFKGGGYYR